jgi:hypothetical protein
MLFTFHGLWKKFTQNLRRPGPLSVFLAPTIGFLFTSALSPENKSKRMCMRLDCVFGDSAGLVATPDFVCEKIRPWRSDVKALIEIKDKGPCAQNY